MISSVFINFLSVLCSLSLFQEFVASFAVLSLFSITMHFLSGKRVIYK